MRIIQLIFLTGIVSFSCTHGVDTSPVEARKLLAVSTIISTLDTVLTAEVYQGQPLGKLIGDSLAVVPDAVVRISSEGREVVLTYEPSNRRYQAVNPFREAEDGAVFHLEVVSASGDRVTAQSRLPPKPQVPVIDGEMIGEVHNPSLRSFKFLSYWENPKYLDIALSLNNYITGEPIKDGKTFVNTDHQYAPAEGIREQKRCFVTMGIHCAHWALLMADLYRATGQESYKERAVQTMNFLTYHLQPDGKMLVGVDHEHEKGAWAFNQFWFSCHIKPNLYLIEFLSYFPKLAPGTENHILSASSGIRQVSYTAKQVSFQATKTGSARIKLSFTPTEILVDNKKTSSDTWRFDHKTGLLEVRYPEGQVAVW
ncbi:MAG: hypothetical protein WCY86_07415 [Spirosomataceae bacterium]